MTDTILITGGAGFIGSNILPALEAPKARPVAVVDRLGHHHKWRNIAKRELFDIVVDMARAAGLPLDRAGIPRFASEVSEPVAAVSEPEAKVEPRGPGVGNG